ncbi:MAG: hypothetical protein CVU20_03570 [Betaproteobacteria bacterium HGW-Betaproteobacteria-14]|nr:MAG: hypothetical protein CVU20_03570 [Betaproteobacteria bacterium HGW-Betaproteobacteria-14]
MPPRKQRGAALLIFFLLLVMAGLGYLVSGLSPESVEVRRAQQNQEALLQAREALIGYALQYREQQLAQGQPGRVYGYLPLPDLGTTRNNNVGCVNEGCDAANFAGNALSTTVIGRLPWRTLGLEPLRDGNGECLWYAVSGSHQRQQLATPMNWDSLAHLDIVVADGTAALSSVLTSAHERPVVVIFSPGPPLPGQDRAPAGGDDVTRCGGNYNVANYLDPATATALGGVTNYLAGTNKASAVTDPNTPKALASQGKIFDTGTAFIPNACQGANCNLVANDIGLSVTGDALFGAIRKSAYFRTDINAMLDRMTFCLRDQAASSGFTPAAISGFTSPIDKSAGRIPDNTCYDASQNPLGYYDHYKEMVFVAKPNSGNFTVNGDTNCAGVLLFANQRGSGQLRVTAAQKDAPGNYLEGGNLTSFTAPGTTFAGDILFDRVTPQAVGQDITRCIPSGGSFTPVESPKLAELGLGQLVAYDTGLRRLILGRNDLTTADADADYLFGCAWLADSRPLGGGLHVYFSFQFRDVGGSVGLNGFAFAVADADPARNNLNACGAGGSHLGYSGNNSFTPKINYPKIGIEFDQSRNTNFSETDISSSNPGRNDPCGTACGGEYNSHVAILYWGHETASIDPGPPVYTINQPDFDDNVHGFPSAAFLAAGTPPLPPRNPDAAPGIAFKNLRQQASEGGNSFTYHVRLELTPTGRADNANARLSHTTFRTEAWIDSSPSASQLEALKNVTRPMSLLAPAYPATLSDIALMYDVALPASTCDVATPCPDGQGCGSDNMCYRPALQTVQLGFTNSQRTTDQEVFIEDFSTTWLP